MWNMSYNLNHRNTQTCLERERERKFTQSIELIPSRSYGFRYGIVPCYFDWKWNLIHKCFNPWSTKQNTCPYFSASYWWVKKLTRVCLLGGAKHTLSAQHTMQCGAKWKSGVLIPPCWLPPHLLRLSACWAPKGDCASLQDCISEAPGLLCEEKCYINAK